MNFGGLRREDTCRPFLDKTVEKIVREARIRGFGRGYRDPGCDVRDRKRHNEERAAIAAYALGKLGERDLDRVRARWDKNVQRRKLGSTIRIGDANAAAWQQ